MFRLGRLVPKHSSIFVSYPGLDLPGGYGGSTPAAKTVTQAGDHLQKCSRGRILTPAVNYGDKTSASK